MHYKEYDVGVVILLYLSRCVRYNIKVNPMISYESYTTQFLSVNLCVYK